MTTTTARRIRLTATPMATAEEYASHPREFGCLVPVQHGFLPWTGDLVGAQAAAQKAADDLAKTLPHGWLAVAYIGREGPVVAASAASPGIAI